MCKPVSRMVHVSALTDWEWERTLGEKSNGDMGRMENMERIME